jgi:general stress protein 26
MIGNKPADPYTATNNENDAPLKDKMESLLHFIERCKYGMLTTRDATSGLLSSRCMELAATESNGTDLLFFTNTHAHKVEELARDPHVNVAFINPTGEWASVAGSATIITDRAVVERHYNPVLKAWLGDLGDGKHDGSASDPRLGMIRVKVDTATCSLSGKNLFSRAAEVVHGAVTGQPAQVAKLREITSSEVNLWRTTGTAA